MPTYLAPGVYVEEKSSGIKPIAGASTSVAAFVGVAERGPVGKATLVTSLGEFVKRFGGPIRIVENAQEIYLYYAVRHFFGHGGTRCYIVRVTEGAVANPYAGVSVGALDVTAISPGVWGRGLSVEVVPTSQYSVQLESSVAAGDTFISLDASSDVRVGSLLWIVDEATGIITDISGTNLTFGDGLFNNNKGLGSATFDIINSAIAYTPDFLLETTLASGGGTFTPGVAPGAPLALGSVTRADGVDLRVGDVVNFAILKESHVVSGIGDPVSGVKQVDLAGSLAGIFKADTSRVYERSFSLVVRENGSVVETHEGLSLVRDDKVNHVAVRLPSEGGASFYVSADGGSTTPVPYAAPTDLTGGDDDLPGTPAGGSMDTMFKGDELLGTGLYALDKVTDASILCVTNPTAVCATAAAAYCELRKDMIFVADPPRTSASVADVISFAATGISATSYAATYYPWLHITDPISSHTVSVPPSGAVAGIYARTDAKRGVHKAPAGTDVGRVDGVKGTAAILTKAQNDSLHQGRVNAIRNTSEGILVWGARTLSSDPEWNYVNVRRLFIFLEQSILRGTQWVAFEPNDASLWKKITRNVSAFLRIQWIEGKLVGATEEEAFYVKCNAETNPPEIVDAGMVVTEIGVAPSKPAEFVVFRIKQIAGGESGT